MLMHNTLQEFIDNLDETDREELDRLKAHFLANEEAYRRSHAAPDPRGTAHPPPLPASH